MAFDTSELTGRASELLSAQKAALEDHGDDCEPYDIPESEITGVYDDFLDVPNPDNFGSWTDDLLTVMEKLAPAGFETGLSDETQSTGVGNSVPDMVASAGDEVDEWTGKGADNFDIWATGWKTGISNQFNAAGVMRILLNAEGAVWEAAAKDLDEISEAATKAMKAVTECNGDDVKLGLSIAGAVVGIAAAIPTGGASLSITAVAAAGIGVASTGMDVYEGATKEDKEISSCCPRCAMDDLKDGLTKIKDKIREGEEKIASNLTSVIATIDGAWSEYCYPAPALGTVPRKDIHSYEGMGSVG